MKLYPLNQEKKRKETMQQLDTALKACDIQATTAWDAVNQCIYFRVMVDGADDDKTVGPVDFIELEAIAQNMAYAISNNIHDGVWTTESAVEDILNNGESLTDFYEAIYEGERERLLFIQIAFACIAAFHFFEKGEQDAFASAKIAYQQTVRKQFHRDFMMLIREYANFRNFSVNDVLDELKQSEHIAYRYTRMQRKKL